MRAFKGKQFSRWAAAEKISDADLCQVEADLGGYLFKKRIARQDGGKSGGYRTILGFRKSNSSRIFFLHGFPKNVRANITVRERSALSANASALIDTTDRQIEELKAIGTILELECGT
jgi:hypothetical protein